jgi:hypothetical protein
MEHKALAALIIRLAGLWQIVVAANALPQAIAPLFNADYARTAGYGWLALNAVLTIAVPLAIGLFLVYFPRTVAGSMLREEGVEPRDASEATRLEQVLVALLGLWFTFQALLDAAYHVSRWHLYERFAERQFPGATGPAIGPQEFAGLVTAGLQLAFGIWLLLGSRGLVNALARLRGR